MRASVLALVPRAPVSRPVWFLPGAGLRVGSRTRGEPAGCGQEEPPAACRELLVPSASSAAELWF